MIRMLEATAENRTLLWNMLQGYLREMSAYYDIDQDAAGNYRYRYFDAYFSEAERKALLICKDQIPVGFAMINTHSYIGAKPDYVLAEFMILPEYRKQRIGFKAAAQIFSDYKGCWELKYSENNAGAKILWSRVTEIYHPEAYFMNDETVLTFSTPA